MPALILSPIVGAHFRPPAKLLLQVLPVDAELGLEAEPENAFDPNAIKVILPTTSIPLEQHSTLAALLPGTGCDIETVLAEPEWHVGYIPKETAARLRSSGEVPEGRRLTGRFRVTPEGKPAVAFEPVEV